MGQSVVHPAIGQEHMNISLKLLKAFSSGTYGGYFGSKTANNEIYLKQWSKQMGISTLQMCCWYR